MSDMIPEGHLVVDPQGLAEHIYQNLSEEDFEGPDSISDIRSCILTYSRQTGKDGQQQ